MFLCQVVPVAALQLSALCRRKWCNSMSVWVWGTVTDDWCLCVVLVTDSDSQLWGAVHDSSLNVCDDRLLASRQSLLHFFSLIHYLHFSKCHHILSIPSSIFICCYLIPFPFPLTAHLFLHPPSSLHLHSLFLPLISRLSPPLLHLLLQSVSWWWGCCDWYAWRARGCFSAERVVNVCLCSPSPPTGCTGVALKSGC